MNKKNMSLHDQYLLGSQFIEACECADSVLTNLQECPSLALKSPGRVIAEAAAESLHMSFQELKPMIEFAFAVNTLRHNCGEEVLEVIFDPINLQLKKSVEMLSRTSETRQRYRLDKVLSKEPKTIRPQRWDPVFDTVAFKEVPSRLARGRGSLLKLAKNGIKTNKPKKDLDLIQLLKLTRDAAVQLGKLTKDQPPTASTMKRLDKETIFTLLQQCQIKCEGVGEVKRALRLTIKNVWDYPEMRRRNLTPTSDQKAKVCIELLTIKDAVKQILAG